MVAFSFIKHEGLISNDQLRITDRGETELIVNHHLNTSKLVDLLQWSVVEHMTTRRDEMLEAWPGNYLVTTDFEAVYAYKRGQYQRCLQLSTYSVRTLTAVKDRWSAGMPFIIHPPFIQLLDDDIVSLIGLRLHESDDAEVDMTQLSLLLYLTAQCQMKLRRSLTSLGRTLKYVQLARARIKDLTDDSDTQRFLHDCVIDHLLLTFVEQKILQYISAD